MLPQQYCLRWKYHHSNLQTMFSQLLDRGCFCDVTLACEGQVIRAHRVVLCACSTFFDTVLTNYASERDPIIIMKDVTFADIKCLIEFMYKGEINVEHTNLASLLKTADDLKIKGLAEVTWRDEDDGPPPPAPQTEFHSPGLARGRESNHHYDPYGHEMGLRSHTPDLMERDIKTPSPKHVTPRMPTLTPIPPSAAAVSIVAAVSPSDAYLGPKRKRGRPPLDDAYDVFNVRKYGDQGDLQPSFMEGSQYSRDDTPTHNHHHITTQHSRPNSPSAAEVYQHHVQQQKQRLRYKPQQMQEKEFNEEETTAEPEWITSSMEPDNAAKDPLDHDEEVDTDDIKILPHDTEDSSSKKSEKRSKESTPEYPKLKSLKRKSSKEENAQNSSSSSSSLQQRSPKTETPDEFMLDDAEAAVPQTVEEMESQQSKEKSASTSAAGNNPSNSAATASSSSSTGSSPPAASKSPSTSAAHKTSASSSASASASSRADHSQHHHSSASSSSNHHGHHASVPPPPLHHPHAHHHYGKYVPDGYLINEHGILMTHDFIHAPTAQIPTSAGGASNGNHPSVDDYADMKMEEFSEAELRLTTEEMSQWQDVIKMDDYLAKGRRPQFWEEPFTRRVLDAIKNKRLEMKKAARILGVSYGTLYGRYREVYGCLKHPYSSTTMRPSQAAALQHRFDIVWPAPKPGQLDIGKLRPKDLSELWTRPQI